MCTERFARAFITIYNVILLITGLGCFGVGIWMNADRYVISYFVVLRRGEHENVLFSGTVLLIIAGILIIFVAFLGCYGLVKNRQSFLKGYAALLIIIFIFEIAIGFMAVAFRHDIHRSLKEGMKKQIKEDYMEDTKVGDAWDFIQVRKKCCGVDEAHDYYQSEYWYGKNGGASEQDAKVWVPKTCCVLQFNQDRDIRHVDPDDAIPHSPLRCQQDAQGRIVSGDNVHDRGCYATLIDKINEHSNILIGIGLAVAILQLMGIIMTFLLLRTMKEETAGEMKYPSRY